MEYPQPTVGDIQLALTAHHQAQETLGVIKNKMEALIKPYVEAAAHAEKVLAAMMKQGGLVNVQAVFGDATLVAEFVPKQAPKAEDWDAFYAWVYENKRADMLHKRLSSSPLVELYQANEPLPPGISITEWNELKVSTKAAKKPRRAA